MRGFFTTEQCRHMTHEELSHYIQSGCVIGVKLYCLEGLHEELHERQQRLIRELENEVEELRDTVSMLNDLVDTEIGL
jgi:flagellar biosynthesis/type III secretory pathway protein FliH